MAEQEALTPEVTRQRGRRRAVRPAGPVNGAAGATGTATLEPPVVKVRVPRPAGPPPRRQPHRRLVAICALTAGFVMAAALAVGVFVLVDQQRDAEAIQARNQRFVDTASQTVVNMFSYTQDNIDESVNRFVDGTSGPLRDMLSQNNNVENLKALFRDTNATSEAVINGAALEEVDEIANNAAVLGGGARHGDRYRRHQQTVTALPVAGHRARGRQRAHDRV